MSNMNLDELEEFVIEKLNEEASKLSLNDFDEFAQNLIKLYNINYNTYEGYNEIMKLSESAVFVNYYADIQLRIYKNYLIKKLNREISDEEAINDALKRHNISANKMLYYPIDDINWMERQKMYQDMNILIELYNQGFFFEINTPTLENMIKAFNKYDISGTNNKYGVLNNIKAKQELVKMGLKEFCQEETSKVLKR